MSKNYLINDERNYQEVKFGEGYLSLIMNISWKNRLQENKLLLQITILIYIYICATVIS